MKTKDYRLLTLSAMCKYAKVREELAWRLHEEMFADHRHKAMVRPLQVAKTTADLVQMTDYVGGLAYVKHLAKFVERYGRVNLTEVARWLDFLDNAMKQHQVKVLLRAAEQEIEKLNVSASADDLIGNLVSGLVSAYRPDEREQGYTSLDSIADELIQDVLNLHDGVVADRVPTGFESNDNFLGGGIPTEVVTIGGNPGVGKTQLAIQVAENVGRDVRYRLIRSKGKENPGIVAIISGEMTKKSLFRRLAQSRAGVRITKDMDSTDAASVITAIDEMRDLPILIDDNLPPDYNRLEALYTRYGGIRLIVADFAELLASMDNEGSREQQVARVFVTAKIMTKRYGCPFLLITQLNREMDRTRAKVPTMRDIRYTGMGEIISGLIILIYYPYGYIVVGQTVQPPSNMPAQMGVAYLIYVKNRDGPTGFIPMGWEGHVTRWSDEPLGGMYHKVSPDEVWTTKGDSDNVPDMLPSSKGTGGLRASRSAGVDGRARKAKRNGRKVRRSR